MEYFRFWSEHCVERKSGFLGKNYDVLKEDCPSLFIVDYLKLSVNIYGILCCCWSRWCWWKHSQHIFHVNLNIKHLKNIESILKKIPCSWYISATDRQSNNIFLWGIIHVIIFLLQQKTRYLDTFELIRWQNILVMHQVLIEVEQTVVGFNGGRLFDRFFLLIHMKAWPSSLWYLKLHSFCHKS